MSARQPSRAICRPALRDEFNDLLPPIRCSGRSRCSVLVNEVFNRHGLRGCCCGSAAHRPGMRMQLSSAMSPAGTCSRCPRSGQRSTASTSRPARHLQTRMLVETRGIVERASRWFLRHRHAVDPAIEVARLRPGVDKLAGCLDELLPPVARQRIDKRVAELVSAGAPPGLARAVSLLEPLTQTLGRGRGGRKQRRRPDVPDRDLRARRRAAPRRLAARTVDRAGQ